MSAAVQKKRRDSDGLRLLTYRRFKEGVDFEPVETETMTALIEFAQHCHNIHRMGRPPVYQDTEELHGVIDAFWDVLTEKNISGMKIVPDVEGFCAFSGISRETLNNWENGTTNKPNDFVDAIKRLKNTMAFVKKQLALTGKMPPIVAAMDFNNNHGYTQRQEHVITANNPLGEVKSPEELAELADAYID